jgi:hypothetical protein
MPHLTTLRAAGFSIWPFDPPALPLAVEIYPRELTGPLRKSRTSSRRLYLSTRLDAQDPAWLDVAAASEDAFDAAVSAVRMSENAAAFGQLPADVGERLRLEGAIWRPVRDPLWR